MAITIDDFSKIWASTSPLTPYEFSESQYKEGWNFIGSTPPSRQMWDFLQKNNDEKMQYLLNNFDNYLPLSGGTMSGAILWSGTGYNVIKRDSGNDGVCIIGGDTDNFSGAALQLFGQTNGSYAGQFYLRASTRSNVNDTSHPSVDLIGNPNGSLTWGGKEVERINTSGSKYIRYENGIQICWGYGSPSSGIVSVTFPLPFIDDYYDCFGCAVPVAAGSGAGRIVTCSGGNRTSSSIKLTVLNLDGSLAGTDVNWFAIGYWK